MDSKRLIASSCRRKILETLEGIQETHLMDLVRRVNSTYNEVSRHLWILETEDIVKTRRCGRMRMVRLNRSSPKPSS